MCLNFESGFASCSPQGPIEAGLGWCVEPSGAVRDFGGFNTPRTEEATRFSPVWRSRLGGASPLNGSAKQGRT